MHLAEQAAKRLVEEKARSSGKMESASVHSSVVKAAEGSPFKVVVTADVFWGANRKLYEYKVVGLAKGSSSALVGTTAVMAMTNSQRSGSQAWYSDWQSALLDLSRQQAEVPGSEYPDEEPERHDEAGEEAACNASWEAGSLFHAIHLKNKKWLEAAMRVP